MDVFVLVSPLKQLGLLSGATLALVDVINFTKHVTTSSSTEKFQHEGVLAGIFFPYSRAFFSFSPSLTV